MRRTGWLLATLLASAVVCGSPGRAEAVDDPWTVGVALGYVIPAIEDWEDNYEKRGDWVPDLSAAYAFSMQWSVAAEMAYFRAKSQARGAITGEPSIEEQQLTLVPTTVSLEYRLRYDMTQLIVPFLGAGYRHVTYRLKVGENETITGGANGWAGRAGFDVLLNGLDPSAASAFSEEYGVARSYFRLEAQWATAEAPGTSGDIDLGGITYLAGVRFEF
ncbi:MAG: outer membrane beta-barrel protein [Nitrospirota bacterium]